MLEGRNGGVDTDYVDLSLAGEPGEGQYRCADCGYGITIHDELPACPMCTGSVWERPPLALLGRLRLERDPLAL